MRHDPLIPAICVVTKIRVDTPDVKTFRVVGLDGKKPFEHIPGQCAMLSIPGVGEARKRLLLQRFGTVKAIRAAELLQLEEVLPKPAARAVYDHFHPENMPKENTP